jgi:hypothetical protein
MSLKCWSFKRFMGVKLGILHYFNSKSFYKKVQFFCWNFFSWGNKENVTISRNLVQGSLISKRNGGKIALSGKGFPQNGRLGVLLNGFIFNLFLDFTIKCNIIYKKTFWRLHGDSSLVWQKLKLWSTILLKCHTEVVIHKHVKPRKILFLQNGFHRS